MTAGLVVIATLNSTSWALIFFVIGAGIDAMTALGCAVATFMGFITWRLTMAPLRALSVALGLLFVTFVVGTIALDSIAELAWLTMVPLLAFILGGLRFGIGWSLATTITVAGTASYLFATSGQYTVADVLRIAAIAPTIAAAGLLIEVSRHSHERRLERARARAISASEAKNVLLAKVSHEIRTPLNGVLGLAEGLSGRQLPADVLADLETIRNSGHGLLRLLNELLDISRAEAGQMEFKREAVDLRRLLFDVVELYSARASDRSLRLSANVTPDTSCWVTSDEGRLRQVLSNLVSNAVKFTTVGEVRLDAQLTVRGSSVALEVRVDDTGPGITEEALARVFEPFTQFDAQRAHEGSGLGLAIAREVSHALGGTLTAANRSEGGARFLLHLEFEAASAPKERPLAQPLRPFRALVADDNAVNRRVARVLLERLGASVVDVVDGLEAIEAAGHSRFDVIFLDLQMPVMDGQTASRKLRERGDCTPIVAMTASAGPSVETECLGVGMNGCVFKPVKLDELREVVREHLRPLGQPAEFEPGTPRLPSAGAEAISPPDEPQRTARADGDRTAGRLEAAK
ncbi:MAG: ATP-binding protein [Myxococcales bacterium]|nr:ATP-binding protein [Myxococcales bacterium]